MYKRQGPDVFLELRYYLVLRAFAVGLRSHLTLEELNTLASLAHQRIYQGLLPFIPFPSVPDFIDVCSYTGYVFPCDRGILPKLEGSDGLMQYPIHLSLALFEFVSYVESVHYRIIERLAPQLFLNDIPLWCPSVHDTGFPDRRIAYTCRFAYGR